MSLKTNFEDTSVLSSPFVDEVANPGGTIDQKRRTTEKEVVAATVESGRKFLSAKQKNTIRVMDAQVGREKNRKKN